MAISDLARFHRQQPSLSPKPNRFRTPRRAFSSRGSLGPCGSTRLCGVIRQHNLVSSSTHRFPAAWQYRDLRVAIARWSTWVLRLCESQARPGSSETVRQSQETPKSPTTSVTVVRIMLEHWAGSQPKDRMMTGIAAPDRPATNRLTTIPRPITSPRIGLPCQSHATNPVTMPVTVPVVTPSNPSFITRADMRLRGISRITRPRMTIAKDWGTRVAALTRDHRQEHCQHCDSRDRVFKHRHNESRQKRPWRDSREARASACAARRRTSRTRARPGCRRTSAECYRQHPLGRHG